MNAAFLRIVFDSVYVLALAAWVGGLAFFTAAIAPILFTGAEAEARRLTRLLPRWYAWGTICGAVALPSAMGVPLSFPEYRNTLVGVRAVAIVAGTLMMLHAGNSLAPAIAAAPADERARRLRRLVGLNGAAIVIGAGLLVAFANRPAPRTSGIVEPSPREHAQREADARREKRPQTNTAAPIAAPVR